MPPRVSPGVASATSPPAADPTPTLPRVDGAVPPSDAAPVAVAALSSRGPDSDARDEPVGCVACGAGGPAGSGRRALGASATPVSGGDSVFGRISARASCLGIGAGSTATGALWTGAGTGEFSERPRGAGVAVMRRARTVGTRSLLTDAESLEGRAD